MSSIHEEFGINEKICFTVTDSGSNFIKAFQQFSHPVTDSDLGEEEDGNETAINETAETESADDFHPIEITDILSGLVSDAQGMTTEDSS